MYMADKKKSTQKSTDKPKTLGTKEVAAKLGITPTTFRRVLRAAGKNTDGEYSRYEWKPEDVQGDKLDKLKKLVEEHTQSKDDGKKSGGKKKSKKKAGSNKKKGGAPADDTEDLGGDEEEEEEEEIS
jgi:hypothetical protein